MYYCSETGSIQSQTGKQEPKLSKTEGTTPGSLNISYGQTELSVKPDNVKIKGLQANVSIPKVRPMTQNNEAQSVLWIVLQLQKDQNQAQNHEHFSRKLR